jgi:hypothetical protein
MDVVLDTLGLIVAEGEYVAPREVKAGDLAGVEVGGGGGTATTVVDWTAFEVDISPVDEVGYRPGGTASTVDKLEF